MREQDQLVARDLSALNAEQLAALRELEISGQQEEFAGSFADTIEAWQAAPKDQIIGLSFHLDGEPVGVVLLKRGPLAPDWAAAGMATLHALKIATPFQGRGLGRPIVGLINSELKERWSAITHLALAVDADNHAALALYRGVGMHDVGLPYMGRVGWEQRLVMAVTLRQ